MPRSANGDVGPISKLLNSVKELLASLISLGRTRLELFTLEIQLEVRRMAEVLLWSFIAIFSAGVGLMMAGLAVILAFWETHRVIAAIAVAAAFFAVAATAGLLVAAKLRSKPRILEGTFAELQRDSADLRSGT